MLDFIIFLLFKDKFLYSFKNKTYLVLHTYSFFTYLILKMCVVIYWIKKYFRACWYRKIINDWKQSYCYHPKVDYFSQDSMSPICFILLKPQQPAISYVFIYLLKNTYFLFVYIYIMQWNVTKLPVLPYPVIAATKSHFFISLSLSLKLIKQTKTILAYQNLPTVTTPWHWRLCPSPTNIND